MRTSGYRHIASVLGLLLLSTAVLKTHAAFAAVSLDAEFLSSRWFVLAIAEFEFFVGGWLVTGVYPRFARPCALMTFLCFLGVSLFNIFRGESSCSCFGVLKASPWIAASIDAAAVIALLLCRSRADDYAPTLSPVRRALLTLTALSLLALPVAFAVSGNAHSPPLIPSTPVVDLGVLSPGELRSTSFGLTNEGNTPVEIAKINSSCHCLTLDCSPRVVPPSGSDQANLALDLGKEPSFVGNLRIHVQGRTRSGELAFSLQVKAKVEDSGFLPQP